MNVLLVRRADVFSPNSVEKDRAVLEAVGRRLSAGGCDVRLVDEERLSGAEDAEVVLSMGRRPETLDVLERMEGLGCIVINRPGGIRNCNRLVVDRIMRGNGIPVAPLYGEGLDGQGYWLKRADACAQTAGDVVFAENRAQTEEFLRMFERRGIADVLVTHHIVGDLVKFYGVAGTFFFRTYYPADDGEMKFADEVRNGKPRYHGYSRQGLHSDVEAVAALTGVDVYGGDCIVRSDGTYAIIDFNDWPSFSRCREEAAMAIAGMVNERICNGRKQETYI